jgi:hypothetical protein
MPTCTILDNAILLRCDGSIEHAKAKALPAGRWLPSGAYSYPNTLVMLIRIRRAFPPDGYCQLRFGETRQKKEAFAWLERFKLAARFKAATELPPVPGEIEPAWDHQRVGFWFAYHMRAAILSQGVGTGKSKEIIDLIRARQHRNALVITTRNGTDDWPKHCEKHGGTEVVSLPLGNAYASVKEKLFAYQKVLSAFPFDRANLITSISYSSVWREPFASFILNHPPDIVVCDEIHKIGAGGSKQSSFCAKLARRVPFRLGASGTVIRHKPEDAYGVFRFIDPAVFGTNETRFKERYCIFNIDPSDGRTTGDIPRFVVGYKNLDEFARQYHALCYHVESSVLNLPEPVDQFKSFELQPETRRIYNELEEDFITYLADGRMVEVTNTLTKTLRLQQLCGGYLGETIVSPDTGKVIDRKATKLESGKAELLAEILDEIDPAEPVCIFAKFRPDFDEIQKVVQSVNRLYFEESGKSHQFREWQTKKGGAVLAGQVQSVSEAIDLTLARYGIFYSVSHSLFEYDQLRGRQNRPGQTRKPIFIHLLARNSIEGHIYKALQERRDVIESITHYYRTQPASAGAGIVAS